MGKNGFHHCIIKKIGLYFNKNAIQVKKLIVQPGGFGCPSILHQSRQETAAKDHQENDQT
jgi:hypothetical protein